MPFGAAGETGTEQKGKASRFVLLLSHMVAGNIAMWAKKVPGAEVEHVSVP